jgi:hypothetical protein
MQTPRCKVFYFLKALVHTAGFNTIRSQMQNNTTVIFYNLPNQWPVKWN